MSLFSKQARVALLAASILVLLSGCSLGPGPQEVAKSYLKALASLEFEEAAKSISDDSKSNLQFIKNLYSDLKPDEQQKFQVKDWSIGSVKEDGDTAAVDFTFDKIKKGQLAMKRVNGAWKVDLRKPF